MRQRERDLELEPDDSYAACLTEDVRLFAQLDDLEAHSDEADAQLVQAPTSVTIKPRTRTRTSSKSTPKGAARNFCDVCERRFSDAYSLRIHKMTHTDERPHVCSVCGKGFRQLSKLRIHSVTHTDQRPYACDICGKGFRFANYLTVHRRLHTGEKPYGCSVAGCTQSFHSVHARRMHAKLQHASSSSADQQPEAEEEEEQHRETLAAEATGSLSYTCPICARVLTDQCYLNTHLKRHFNQRDFACSQPGCGKRFFSSSELTHHQIAHTRLRPFRCALCGSRFLRKSNYKQHLKLHEGAKGGD